jgi:hypothetical protein
MTRIMPVSRSNRAFAGLKMPKIKDMLKPEQRKKLEELRRKLERNGSGNKK